MFLFSSGSPRRGFDVRSPHAFVKKKTDGWLRSEAVHALLLVSNCPRHQNSLFSRVFGETGGPSISMGLIIHRLVAVAQWICSFFLKKGFRYKHRFVGGNQRWKNESSKNKNPRVEHPAGSESFSIHRIHNSKATFRFLHWFSTKHGDLCKKRTCFISLDHVSVAAGYEAPHHLWLRWKALEDAKIRSGTRVATIR